MTVERKANLIIVMHNGDGTAQDARDICAAIRSHASKLKQQGQRIVIFHDSRPMSSASDSYAMEFGRLFKDIKNDSPTQVALIEKPLLRVLAKIATRFARTDMEVVSTADDATNALMKHGIHYTVS